MCAKDNLKNNNAPPCRRSGGRCQLEHQLLPQNRFVWDFFWAMEALGFNGAVEYYRHSLIFKSEYDHGSFFERLRIIKTHVEKWRAEEIKNITS